MKNRLTLKNPQQEIRSFNRHLLAASAICLLLILLLIVRLGYLQLYLHREYATLSRQNQVSIVPIVPNRGLIFDRNGVLLADNVPVFSLEVLPDQVTDIQSTLSALKQLLPINLEEAQKQIKSHRRTDIITLRTRLTEQEVANFSVNQYRFPGVAIKAELLRYYPLGSALVHVLGYVGRINEKELSEVDSTNYSGTRYIGKLGIERFYEDTLHGTVGYQEIETDAAGHTIRVLKHVPPIPGQNLTLTIDSRLQIAAEKALGDESGAIVAIQPQTGAILALVSNPGYDPNLFVQGISSKDYQALQDSLKQPLYNRALRGQYPPGSTIKPFLGLAGLESNLITARYSLYDPGWFKLPNSTHLYRDWKREGHGWVDLNAAIMQSCDTYFYQLAAKLGIERIDDILIRFGFGRSTGIDIHEELPGLVPTPAWKRRNHGAGWYPGDTLITGIGQGFMLATPLQLAMATATLANHGHGFQPHLLLFSQAANGTRYLHQSVVLPPIDLPSTTWQVVLDAMREVIRNSRGTGYRFSKDLSYTMAAKTGTVQVFSLKKDQKDISDRLPEHLRDHSMFIAFAPVENPEIALAVVAEHSTAAGNIARQITDFYLTQAKEPVL